MAILPDEATTAQPPARAARRDAHHPSPRIPGRPGRFARQEPLFIGGLTVGIFLGIWQLVASLRLVPRIRVPTLILTARDDPFIDVEPFEALDAPAHIEVQIVRHGGHLGFLGSDGAGGVRWAERRLVDWVVGAT